MSRPHISVNDRRLIVERAQSRCEYCLSPAEYATQSFDIDHIVPLGGGGTTVIDNLALACSGCNSHKFKHIAAPDPIDGAETPLYHPRRQCWQDHFVWSEDFSEVIGITPTGRATVVALQLNRPGVVSLRKLLRQVGKHPQLPV